MADEGFQAPTHTHLSQPAGTHLKCVHVTAEKLYIKNGTLRGVWLAPPEQHVTPELRVRSLSPPMGAERM